MAQRSDRIPLIELIDPDFDLFDRADVPAITWQTPTGQPALVTFAVMTAVLAIMITIAAVGGDGASERVKKPSATTLVATTIAGSSNTLGTAPAIQIGPGIPARRESTQQTFIASTSKVKPGATTVRVRLAGNLAGVQLVPVLAFFDRRVDGEWRTVAYVIESFDTNEVTIRPVNSAGDLPEADAGVPVAAPDLLVPFPIEFLPAGSYRICRDVPVANPDRVEYMCATFFRISP